MLKPDWRMKDGDTFAAALRRGKTAATEHLVGKLYGDAAGVKVGIIVSKKVSLLATRRNTVKRRLRAAIHSERSALGLGDRMVVIAKPGAAAVEWKQLHGEVRSLLSALKKHA